MNRVFVSLAAWLVVGGLVVGGMAARAGGSVFYLEGQIAGGGAGFPRTPLDFIPFDHLPVAYSGTFRYEPGGSRATFEIAVGSGFAVWPSLELLNTNDSHGAVENEPSAGSGFAVWPSLELLNTNDFQGAVHNEPAALMVDLSSRLDSWVTSLELSLDKATGQGQWRWSEGQPPICTAERVCAPSVPGSEVSGTITAFREVPEAGVAAMASAIAFGAFVCGWRKRRGRSGEEERGVWTGAG